MALPSAEALGTAKFASIAPPMLGWNTRDPVPSLKPGFAPILDNFVIEAGVPRVRRGYRAWVTGLPGRVDGLMAWNGAGTDQKLFASSGAGIYNVTTAGAVGSAVVSGLTSARWNGQMVSASGGNFLFCFNGVDAPRTFDGTTWALWGGTGVTGGVAWGGSFKGRLFLGNTGRLSFFYGGAGAIAGAFTEFPLQGIASMGGGVCAMATLAAEGGNGPQDLIAFLTTEGECIVYGGTDPSSASTWGLVGRWRLPRPLASPHRSLAPYGADVLVATEIGVMPLSAFRGGADVSVLEERRGTTRKIRPTWQDYVTQRGTASSSWGVTPLTRLGLVVMNIPWSATATQQVVLSEGDALSRWTNVPAACWIEALGGRAFFGDATSGGTVYLYGEDVSDAGNGINSEAVSTFALLGQAGRIKRVQLVQPVMRDASAATIGVNVLTDWQVPTSLADAAGASYPSPPIPVSPLGNVLVWGVGLWGGAVWGGANTAITLPWRGVRSLGQAMAVRMTIVSGTSRPAWMGSNLTYDTGGIAR